MELPSCYLISTPRHGLNLALSIIKRSIMLNHRQSSPVDSVLSICLAVYSYLVKVIGKSADCFCCFYFGFYVAHFSTPCVTVKFSIASAIMSSIVSGFLFFFNLALLIFNCCRSK